MDTVAHTSVREVVPPNKEAPLVSFVVTARNDDHGGGFLQRMQIFVTALLAQAARHGLRSELIIVEWNPPPDRPRLAEALRWPSRPGPCRVRIIEVPPRMHRRYRYSEKLGLFQMIAKNVGVRRARGYFVLCTNIDILFSDALIRFLASGRLDPRHMYRIDRLDVPAEVPLDASVDEQLEYCRQHIVRVNTRWGTFDANELGYLRVVRRFMERWLVPFVVSRVWRVAGLCRGAARRVRGFCMRLGVRVPGARWLWRAVRVAVGHPERVPPAVAGVGRWIARHARTAVLHPGRSGKVVADDVQRCLGWLASWLQRTGTAFVQGILGILRGVLRMRTVGAVVLLAPWAAVRAIVFATRSMRLPLRTMLAAALRLQIRRVTRLHTNGCGDFTMLSRDRWARLRGYPEWALYSLHIDAVLCEMAFASGVREVLLRRQLRAYHIDHHSGWSPAEAGALERRLTTLGVPMLDYRWYCSYTAAMRLGDAATVFNGDSWGLGAEVLPETDPVASGSVSSRPAHPDPEAARV